MYDRAIIIVEPHGTKIMNRTKKMIVKSKKFSSMIGKKLLLIENKLALGYIELDLIGQMNLREFKKMYKFHLISEEERIRWWRNKKVFYAYSVKILKKFRNPKKIEYPIGPQVFIKPENIKFV